MTSTFRGAGAWGAGVGRPLTWIEQDNNTYDKETRITAIEAAGVAVGIASITQSGGQLIITMTDASVYTFDLTQLTPIWNFTGDWQASHVYQALDVVTFGGSAYLVNVDHTSATDFDPNETVTGSQDIYSLMWSYAPAPGVEISAATFTPDLVHANNYIRLTHPSGCIVSIDPSISFLDWTELTFRDESTDTGAAATFEVATPGSINDISGHANQSAGQGSVVTLKKVGATDAWDIMGRLQTITA